MSEHCEQEEYMADIRKKIIGLGASGQRKSYYPQLQEHIAELERTNQALAQSEEKYRTIVENIDVGIFRTSPGDDGKIVQANPAMARILGYSNVEELISHSPIDLYIQPRHRRATIARLDRDNVIKNMKSVLSHKSGRPINVLLTLKAHRNEEGKIEWIDGVMVDMTVQERARRRIEEERARLQAIFDTLPVGIMMIDSTGNVLMANDSWINIWRIENEAEAGFLDRYVGRRVGKSERLRREEWSIARAFRGEYIFDEEIDVQRFDGSMGTFLTSAAPIYDRSGKIIGAVSTIVDITSRRELEKELDDARSRAEMYVDLLTHDISNYNAAAMGYLQLADMSLDLDERDSRLILRPLEELKNSTELIANIWDLQRVESGREKGHPINVATMLQQVIRDHMDVPDREVKITMQDDCDCHVIASDLLSVVFSNIISNAIKHSQNALVVNVKVSRVTKKDYNVIRIEIEDDGPGIPDEKKEAIFNRALMGLSKPVSRGLGLYLVKRLVADYGGDIWVEDRIPNEYEQGARFVIELPAAPLEKNVENFITECNGPGRSI
ncbi:MAG: PAS domain-containing sensor histidine kinase [Euryarchaeota archaeon]|nr:PAS domain-containing sensor histidine kinase [Euryarchaeota archaeon]